MSETADYLLKLFRFQLEKGNFETARQHLELLSLHLPHCEIERLETEIPDWARQARKVQVDKKSERQPQLSERARQIRAFLAERQVEHLVHFTRMDNVTTITQHGLLPRARPDRSTDLDAYTNDDFRHDGHRNASCLSISFPNYQMFFQLRKEFGTDESYWAVLQLQPEILWCKDCAFMPTNAADRTVRARPVYEWKTFDALRDLFEDFQIESDCIPRPTFLDPFYTTNPQAEVLVFDVIEPEYIQAVCINRDRFVPVNWRSKWVDVEVRTKPVYFGPRKDYAVWSGR